MRERSPLIITTYMQMYGSGPGCNAIFVPSNYTDEYKFLSVINSGDNAVYLYPSGINTITPGMELLYLPPGSSRTIPVTNQMLLGFNAVWTNPNNTALTSHKPLVLIFSLENLCINITGEIRLKDGDVNNAYAVTPTDGTDLDHATSAIFIGGDGDIKVDLVGSGSGVVFKGLAAGVFYPIRCKRIYSTGTTATDIIGVY